MTEAMAVEAIRASGVNQTAMQEAWRTQAVADPEAIQAFEAAMDAPKVSDIPFAQQISATWQASQVEYQAKVHQVQALVEMNRVGGMTSAGMVELQYEVASLSFQQEVVTSIAKKSSDAVSTLVKNG